jgi:hypothetical protein
MLRPNSDRIYPTTCTDKKRLAVKTCSAASTTRESGIDSGFGGRIPSSYPRRENQSCKDLFYDGYAVACNSLFVFCNTTCVPNSARLRQCGKSLRVTRKLAARGHGRRSGG